MSNAFDITKESFYKKLDGCLVKKSCAGYHNGGGSIGCLFCDAIGLSIEDLKKAKTTIDNAKYLSQVKINLTA